MAKGRKEEMHVLYRCVRFEIKPTPEQEELLLRISAGLQSLWNWGLEWRKEAYEKYKEQKQAGIAKPNVKLPTLFDQINALTSMREEDKKSSSPRANIPRNWQEETLDTLDGAFKSFFALAKKGDQDARPPRERDAEYFCEIPGRSGYTVKEGSVTFAPNLFGKDVLSFPIPAYCQGELAKGLRNKKFTLFRDESQLSKAGRYWVSIAYEIAKPEPLAFRYDSAIFLALGGTWLGVLTHDREEVIKLWRPDKYWKPLIEAAEAEMSKRLKGSRRWLKALAGRRKIFQMMSNQQKQNQREVVKKLLEHGVHFVVEDLTIRGGLADGSKPERGELNWSVQNTGSIARLVAHLNEKAMEHGGYVIQHKPASPAISGLYGENKIPMARRLEEDFRTHGRSP